MYSMFIDLKASFDTVDREILWDIMRKLGIRDYLIERIKGCYEETKARAKTKEGLTKEFWITKGLRQGCVLNPSLFCIYIAELEEAFRLRNIGGVCIGKERIWSLGMLTILSF